MSYDLMVFEPEAAPKDHYGFLEWCAEQTKWNEGHSYNDPSVTSARLRAWFLEVIRFFPTLNGVFAEEELPEDEATAADYSIGRQMIYIGFAWSKAELACQTTLDLATKHDLGFFNISSQDEEVWLPAEGGLILVHQRGTTS
jgi:hypothetical protein